MHVLAAHSSCISGVCDIVTQEYISMYCSLRVLTMNVKIKKNKKQMNKQTKKTTNSTSNF